jgi:putative aminopeptidase FrvX
VQTLELIRILTDAFGPAGFEDDARAAVRSLVEPLADEVREDALGSLVALVRGRSERVLMLDAHLDEIGLIINYIDEQGFLRFAALGTWDDRILLAQRVVVRTRAGKLVPGVIGMLPPHLQKKDERERVIKIEEMFIDVGAASRAEALALGLGVGDPAVVHYPCAELSGGTVTAKALDNRAGCAVAVRVLERLAKVRPELTVAATFTVCEEVGARGARTTAFRLEPEVALVLEGTIGGGDGPGAGDLDRRQHDRDPAARGGLPRAARRRGGPALAAQDAPLQRHERRRDPRGARGRARRGGLRAVPLHPFAGLDDAPGRFRADGRARRGVRAAGPRAAGLRGKPTVRRARPCLIRDAS